MSPEVTMDAGLRSWHLIIKINKKATTIPRLINRKAKLQIKRQDSQFLNYMPESLKMVRRVEGSLGL